MTRGFSAWSIAVVLLAAILASGQVKRTALPAGDAPSFHPAKTGPKYRANALLVRFRPGTSSAGMASAHRAAGASVVRSYHAVTGLQLVRLPSGTSVARALGAYRRNPAVLYAEPDYRVTAVGAPVIPNDPLFNQQWDMNNTGQSGGTVDADIDAPEAWSLTTGGTNVAVGVIDTGFDYSHQDLSANIWFSPFSYTVNGVNCPTNSHGFNVVAGTCDPMDDNEHGTHVSGTIGAKGNNGVGVAGVNWNVTLIACKFLDSSGPGYISDAVTCLEFFKDLKDNHGINLVATNNSWGGGGYSQAVSDAIDAHRRSGILFVAAAGNGDLYGNPLDNDVAASYPADYYLPNVIAVASTTRDDVLSSFSNYGKRTVHLGAPGSAILSTTPGNNYSSLSGTSMAAPHVTGVAALLKAQAGSRDWRALKNLILAGADDKPSLTAKTVTGKRLNANGSLTCSNQVLTDRLRPWGDLPTVAAGNPVLLAALHINCAAPAGNVTVTINPGGSVVTLKDDGVAPDQAAGDGIYAGEFTFLVPGQYTVSLSGGETFNVNVLGTYSYQPVANNYRSISGTSLNFSDDEHAQITPGFPIDFAGSVFSSLWVSANGTISLDSPFSGYFNSPLPVAAPATLLAPFWDDLVEPNASQNVFWEVTGSTPNRELVVEWRDVIHYQGQTDESVRFQVVLFESKSDILFNYADVTFGGTSAFADYGSSATVGVQVASNLATQFSFNTPSLADNTALLWTTASTRDYSLSISNTPQSVYVPNLPATFHGTATAFGSYSGLVNLSCLNGGTAPPTTCTDAPNPVTPTAGGTPFTVIAGNATVGDFSFNLHGVGTDADTLTHDTAITLHIVDFTAATPAVVVPIQRGNTGQATITVSGKGTFTDTVHLSCPSPPPNFTCTFLQNDFVPSSAGTAVTLMIGTNSSTALGSASIIVDVTGSSAGAPTRTATVGVEVTPGLAFVPMPPCRIADTRLANGPFGGPFLKGGAPGREFDITSNTSCFPSAPVATPRAYSLNLTVVPRGALGYLTAFPCGTTQPLASNLNSLDGRIKAVAAIVPAGTPNSSVCIFANSDTDFVLDINGYFISATDPSSPLAFFPLPPCRVVDTRNPAGTFGGPTIPGGTFRTFPVLSSSCASTIPASVQAYSLNFTAVPKGGLGYLTTWPAGQSRPLVSTLNALTGAITANAAIVPAGTEGAVSVYVNDTADVVIDMDGYFAPYSTGTPANPALSLFPMTPCRVLDTRNGAGAFTGELPGDEDVQHSACAPAPSAQAYVLNATVVPSGGLGYLTLWPQGMSQPLVSTLNALDGQITSNMAIVPTTNGWICAYASNKTHLVLDISGYFGP